MDEILLGDAYELIKDIPDKSIDCIITDPPYLYKDIHFYQSKLFGKRSKSKTYDRIENKLDKGFDFSLLDEFLRVLKTPNLYIWCSKDQMFPLMKWGIEKHNFLWKLIVWNKTNPTPFCEASYLNDCEYCLYFHKGVKFRGQYKTAKSVYVTGVNSKDSKLYNHPTIKPRDIIDNLVLNSTSEGGVILDPFIGSGTTAESAKSLGRHYIGFEIDPEYHRIATERLEGITQKAKRIGYIQETLF